MIQGNLGLWSWWVSQKYMVQSKQNELANQPPFFEEIESIVIEPFHHRRSALHAVQHIEDSEITSWYVGDPGSICSTLDQKLDGLWRIRCRQ